MSRVSGRLDTLKTSFESFADNISSNKLVTEGGIPGYFKNTRDFTGTINDPQIKVKLAQMNNSSNSLTKAEVNGISEVAGKPDLGDRLIGTHGELVKLEANDSHHIIQHAAVRDIQGYERNAAPAIQLKGPSTTIDTEHYIATQAQRSAFGGGTYGAERRIAYRSLREAGLNVDEAKSAVRYADRYFMDELGLQLDTPLNVPGNRYKVK